MPAEDELEALPSERLHALSVKYAVRHVDLGFFWRLLQILPAAEASVGDMDDAQGDIQSLLGHVDDITDSGRGEVADALRPFYLEYLREHHVAPDYAD